MDKEIIKFNSNSPGFSLGWGQAVDREPSLSVLSDRGNKFIKKSNNQLARKVGSPEVHVQTPLLSPRATRNQRQKGTFYVVSNNSKYQSTLCPAARTSKQWSQLNQQHEEGKTTRANIRKNEVLKLQDQKWARLKKKFDDRQPFRF